MSDDRERAQERREQKRRQIAEYHGQPTERKPSNTKEEADCQLSTEDIARLKRMKLVENLKSCLIIGAFIAFCYAGCRDRGGPDAGRYPDYDCDPGPRAPC